MTLIYTPEIGERILEKIHRKGWNVYNVNNLNVIGGDETIRQNFSEVLDVGNKYLLMPIAQDPRNPEEVYNELEILAQGRNREMPTIQIGLANHPLTGFTLWPECVKVITPEGTVIPYDFFLESLNSIVETRMAVR